ncbi:uncharacterized protein [Arachis hypogaea]|uniref:uncharacterized protein n=1 Tax=Arachis hypogaea TaxID=3818 RepID=UPI003B214A9C
MLAKQKAKARRSRPKSHKKGNGCARWEYVGSDGASGGLLNEKLIVREELSYITGLCQGPCYFLGDFNEIVQVEERQGNDTLPSSAEDFKNWISDMGLEDLPITDRKFTWFRGRSCSRIDRALVNLEWLEVFPETRLRGGPRGLSDHCPIIVEVNRQRDGPRPFRSLDSWFTHEGFMRLVKEEWRGLSDLQFTDKLKALTGPLGRWHKANFSDMDKKIAKFEDEIKKLDDMVSDRVYDRTVEVRRRALVVCCEKWYVRKELHWKQLSRSKHAKDMDKNTRYFHNLASARRRNNRIDELVINGRLIRNQARIKVAINGFNKNLYYQERSPRIGFRNGLVNVIREEDTLALELQPTPQEVREAVWDCESSKAPGSDGYNMNFIKKCWDVIGAEFTAACWTFSNPPSYRQMLMLPGWHWPPSLLEPKKSKICSQLA